MAVTTINPYPDTSDLMELKEVQAQLKVTGHPVTLDVIKYWIRSGGLPAERYKGRVHVSYSDALVKHREWVASKA
ncbi:hypothetical protein ACIOEZ_34070 [Streptomyces sp. NPDC087866]|uniref:hypothetical protein n=1 Tax=Streptomyces sp. NPDC087866 TaxID=3365815 RepID=UPI0038138C40